MLFESDSKLAADETAKCRHAARCREVGPEARPFRCIGNPGREIAREDVERKFWNGGKLRQGRWSGEIVLACAICLCRSISLLASGKQAALHLGTPRLTAIESPLDFVDGLQRDPSATGKPMRLAEQIASAFVVGADHCGDEFIRSAPVQSDQFGNIEQIIGT